MLRCCHRELQKRVTLHPIGDHFSRSAIGSPIGKNRVKLRMPQSRGLEPPRGSRSQHSNPGGARCHSSTSVAQMRAAASVKVMDALFGLVARNDAEWSR